MSSSACGAVAHQSERLFQWLGGELRPFLLANYCSAHEVFKSCMPWRADTFGSR